MKLSLSLFCLLIFSTIAWAQNDGGVPTTSSGGGIKSIDKKPATHAQLIIKQTFLITDLSETWKECKGDNTGMTSLQIIAANLLAVYEAHQKGAQPECDECQKKVERYECMKKKTNDFSVLREFIDEPYAAKFLHREYKGVSKREARELLDTFRLIINGPVKTQGK